MSSKNIADYAVDMWATHRPNEPMTDDFKRIVAELRSILARMEETHAKQVALGKQLHDMVRR